MREKRLHPLVNGAQARPRVLASIALSGLGRKEFL
jgi:hypothetical protein